MLISEVAAALTTKYREHKKANGGHKTVAKGKYGYKTIQFKLQDSEGTVYGPFLGQGSVFNAYRNEVRLKGKPVVGVKFLVEEVFKPRDKKKETTIDNVTVFEVTRKGRQKKAE